MVYQHTPVMLKEVLEYLHPQAGQNFIDCTLGGAGYALAIAARAGGKGKVLAIDLDKSAIENAKQKIADLKLNNIILANDNFSNLSKIVHKYFGNEKSIKFNGIVFDLGLSSAQLGDRNRGFSFQFDAPLNMEFGQSRVEASKTEIIVNKWKQEDLARIFKEYGEERYANSIARAVARYRKNEPIKTTGQLVEIIRASVPKKYLFLKINPATRVFQALRIATNDELESLKEALPQALDLLAPKGRIVIIAFHSLEDRIVKNFFKQEARDCLCPPEFPVCRCGHKKSLKILTKALAPSLEEIKQNPRARSAKLRVAEKR